VNFFRARPSGNPLLQFHARAFSPAEALGKGAECTRILRAIHERGTPLDTEQKLQEFFGRGSVDAHGLQTAFDSSACTPSCSAAEELNRRYRIGGCAEPYRQRQYQPPNVAQTANYEDFSSAAKRARRCLVHGNPAISVLSADLRAAVCAAASSVAFLLLETKSHTIFTGRRS